MNNPLKIGTRESQLAVWQATLVQKNLLQAGISAELEFIKSEGDIDTITPLYALGVQGIFTKTLDAALLNKRIDLAVHSLKDVPTQLPAGIVQVAVLERASHKDILVYNQDIDFMDDVNSHAVIATSSVRRKAQWLHRYPNHLLENLRGNVNTRLRKLSENGWNGAIFAAAGLERINLRPTNAIDLDWMLPAPSQGAIVIVCREGEEQLYNDCRFLNHLPTETCTNMERAFLKTLQGGCTTPISALAVLENGHIHFRGNICSPDGKVIVDTEMNMPADQSIRMAEEAAMELLQDVKVKQIIAGISNAKK